MKLTDLEQLRFSYTAVGSTRYDETPSGYHRMEHRALIGQGDQVFRRAGEALMSWKMHSAAGVRIKATDSPAVIGTNSLGRLGAGPIGVPVPCRVVWTVDEPDRIGFAYGTLPGHPETGEESFVVSREGDDIYFALRAYSRPATWYTRLSGPLGRAAQKLFAHRYAKALQRLAN
ncbi:uncharacterized protein (UPF0548 family) [Kribbella amoyensis]|uniref:Uncharacterized protein (UPF0548 family) n=1 Tax=Kribbella amoyensis TaxID=996641 RepID=A0A561BSD0_9ACTN|nr:DUF1990 domain-containing protein [Kribbella amoyensis]TWD81794.1 uncharacterized protein (UPF0548 family) [Kribbella amoyensis]